MYGCPVSLGLIICVNNSWSDVNGQLIRCWLSPVSECRTIYRMPRRRLCSNFVLTQDVRKNMLSNISYGVIAFSLFFLFARNPMFDNMVRDGQKASVRGACYYRDLFLVRE